MPVSPATQPEPNWTPARLWTTATDRPSPSTAVVTVVPAEPWTHRAVRRCSISGAWAAAKSRPAGSACGLTAAASAGVMGA